MARPGIEMLAHGGQHHAEEPPLAAGQAGVVETEVEFLALDGAFGTRASVGVELPEGRTAPQGREQAVVVGRVGIDRAAIGRIGTVVREVGTGVQRTTFGRQRAAPLQAQALGIEAMIGHGLFRQADGDTLVREAQGWGELEMAGVALVERDDRVELPLFGTQTIQGERVMGFIQRGGGDAKTEEIDGFVHGGQVGHRVMPMVIQDVEDEGQLAVMLQGVGGEFVQAMPVDLALPIRIPAPAGQRVMQAP